LYTVIRSRSLLDVSRTQGVHAATRINRRPPAAFGGLDIVVASAGLAFVGSAGDIQDDDAMDALASARDISRQDAYDQATAQVPMKRAATAQEIAACCLFLALDEASIVTGTTLVADGGGLAVDPSSTMFQAP
jgi:NAD(P)-dependent dehydrogenase (short-subunit alcohol dehydrogenase family)